MGEMGFTINPGCLMTFPFVLSLFLAWTLIPSNIAGRTKKTIVVPGFLITTAYSPPNQISSGIFLGYCVGNMCGSQIFKTADAPRVTYREPLDA
ncbi:hypothetical protein C8R43DRAFT_1036735 [Mycena crocata]|nr:hypothetical protein C8R43DRAFT_1036735 [Mycena crocata]